MKRLTEQRAQELKAQGYTHIISICKSVYFTRYFKVAPIDACIGQIGIAGNRGITEKTLDRKGYKTISWSQI